MSEELVNGNNDSKNIENSSVLVSGGAMLRKAREAAGLQMAALAVSLKVPVKKLEALETDRFDLLPDTVFVRALAASVCRTLKIDAAPILERLPHTAVPSLKSNESGINTPFRSSATGSTFAFLSHLSKPFFFAVLALLIGVVILIFVPLKQSTEPVLEVKNAENSMLNSTISSPASDTVIIPSPLVVESAPPAQVVGADRENFGSAATATPVSSGVAMLADVGAVAGTVVFKARDTSWVEVIDANGAIQARKTMAGGDVVTVSGAMPLAIVVGRVSNMDVLVRGQPFDLLRVAKDNVARFEVK